MKKLGTESVRDQSGVMAPLLPKKPQKTPPPSKSELRSLADAALAQWVKKQSP